MADTIGTHSAASSLREARQQIRQAHRERPDQSTPHGDHKRGSASESEARRANRPDADAEHEPYQPTSREAQVLAQELAAERKAAAVRRPLTQRSGPYRSRREHDQPFSPPDGPVKLSI